MAGKGRVEASKDLPPSGWKVEEPITELPHTQRETGRINEAGMFLADEKNRKILDSGMKIPLLLIPSGKTEKEKAQSIANIVSSWFDAAKKTSYFIAQRKNTETGEYRLYIYKPTETEIAKREKKSADIKAAKVAKEKKEAQKEVQTPEQS